MAGPHTKINLGDVEDVAPANGFGRALGGADRARGRWSAEQTGLAHYRLRPGKRSPFTHRHERAEEVYVILSGAGQVKLDDEVTEVRVLDTIRVAPEVTRAFEAGPDGLEFLAVGAHHPGDGVPVEDPWSD